MRKSTTNRTPEAFEKGLVTRPKDKCFLRLYVAGATDRSRQAVLRVRKMCDAELGSDYDLEVIDIYQQPIRARDGQILATPTLVREVPQPVRRLIGNLSNTTCLFASSDTKTKNRAD